MSIVLLCWISKCFDCITVVDCIAGFDCITNLILLPFQLYYCLVVLLFDCITIKLYFSHANIRVHLLSGKLPTLHGTLKG